MPLSVDIEHGNATLGTIKALKENFPRSKVVAGLSNVSFGLPKRKLLNRNFLALALHAGLDGAICDPLDSGLMATAKAVEALLGKDKKCRAYCRAARKGALDE